MHRLAIPLTYRICTILIVNKEERKKKKNNIILSAALGPAVFSAFNRNEYQKQRNNVSGGEVRLVRRTNNLVPSVSRFSKKMWDPYHLRTL
jgi:hypothetical protein